MYICHCQAVTEDELHAAIEAGAVTLKRLRESLQVATCCGRCTDRVKGCVRRASLRRQALAVSSSSHPDRAQTPSI